jgi:hypothetical protein
MATDKARILRTEQEIFEAGQQNARQKGWKLTPERAALMAAIVRPYLRRDAAA